MVVRIGVHVTRRTPISSAALSRGSLICWRRRFEASGGPISQFPSHLAVPMECFGCCIPTLGLPPPTSVGEITRDAQYFNEGSKAQDQQQWEKAIDFFKKAVQLKGDNAMYLYHLAYCQQEVAPDAGPREEAYNKEALRNYQQVLKINPNHHEAWYNLGYVQEELMEYDNAITSFKKALELRPNDKDALINLGNCYMELDKFEDSVTTYHEAIRLEPDCVMSHYNLASAHHSAAQQEQLKAGPNKAAAHYKDARAEFRKAIELNADYADAYFNLGICYQDEHMDKEAMEMYNKAAELQPDMVEALEAIQQLERGISVQHDVHKGALREHY